MMILILLGAGCGQPENPVAARTPSPVAVVVETAERRDVPIMAELVARTEAAATVEIRANVEGRLTEMSFQEGRMVQKGQVLFRIDPRRYEAAVQSAGAAVEKAQADLEMAREQQHLVNAQSALRQAEASLLKSNQDAERLKPLAARRAVPELDLDAAIAAQSSAAAAVEDARATVRTTTVGDRMGLRQAQASLTAAQAALETRELDLRGNDHSRSDQAVSSAGWRSPWVTMWGAESPVGWPPFPSWIPINVVFSIPESLYLDTVQVETARRWTASN